MSVQELLHTITEKLAGTASVRNVYGDPITVGDRTVVPIAKVRYAFGAGGGGRVTTEGQKGGGGGGKVSACPCGALEITPQGTRFVPVVEPKVVGLTLAAGIVLGAVLTSLAMTKRIEIVKQGRR